MSACTLAIVIPYFQREPGILRRALQSVLRQKLEPGVEVEIVVVDDGSPVPAATEIEGLVFHPPFRLTLLPQRNGGVAAARNAGLNHLDATTDYIAFLDSDDSWEEEHLRQGLAALAQGHDLYFCDNRREGHHDSYFAACSPHIRPFIEASASPDAIVTLTPEEATTVILRDFASQASTTLHRRRIAPALRFDTSMKNAGEDIIFFLSLTAKAARIAVSPKAMVRCGEGINMYFGNLGWNSPGHLRRLVDGLRAHLIIRRQVPLKPHDREWNDGYIAKLKRDFTFHSLRLFARNKGRWPQETRLFAREGNRFTLWFPFYALQVVLGRMFKLYRPS